MRVLQEAAVKTLGIEGWREAVQDRDRWQCSNGGKMF